MRARGGASHQKSRMLSYSALLAAAYVWPPASLHLTSWQLVLVGKSCSNPRAHTASEGHWLNPDLVGRWSHFSAKPFLIQSRTNPNPNPNPSAISLCLNSRYFYDPLILLPCLLFPLTPPSRPCRDLTTPRMEPLLHAGTPHHLLALTLRVIRTSSCLTSPPDRSGRLPHSLLVTHFQTCRLRCRDMGTFRFSL